MGTEWLQILPNSFGIDKKKLSINKRYKISNQ